MTMTLATLIDRAAAAVRAAQQARSDATRQAEDDKISADRAAQLARAAAAASPDDPALRWAADDLDRAHRDAGRRLAETAEAADAPIAAAQRELDRLRALQAEDDRIADLEKITYSVTATGEHVETLASWRRRQDEGTRLPPGITPYDVAAGATAP